MCRSSGTGTPPLADIEDVLPCTSNKKSFIPHPKHCCVWRKKHQHNHAHTHTHTHTRTHTHTHTHTHAHTHDQVMQGLTFCISKVRNFCITEWHKVWNSLYYQVMQSLNPFVLLSDARFETLCIITKLCRVWNYLYHHVTQGLKLFVGRCENCPLGTLRVRITAPNSGNPQTSLACQTFKSMTTKGQIKTSPFQVYCSVISHDSTTKSLPHKIALEMWLKISTYYKYCGACVIAHINSNVV